MKFPKITLAGLAVLAFAFTACNENSATSSAQKKDFKFIDKANMDTTVSASDNFFLYANGTWLSTTAIPGDKTRWGSFDELNHRTNQDVHNLLEMVVKNNAKAGTTEGNVALFYKSGMDTSAIEQLGIQPIQHLLDEINAIQSEQDLLNVVAKFYKQGIHSIIAGYISPDDKDVTKLIPQFFQAGLGLPSKDYYTETDDITKKNQEAYKAYIQQILVLNGQDESTATKNAQNIFALESALAKASLRPVEMRDPQKLYNKFSLAQFSTQTPNINWNSLFEKFGINGQDSFIVATPNYYKTLSGLLKSTPIQNWKDYLTFHTISDLAPFLSSKFNDANFEFYSKTLSGQQQQKPRWERVMSVINGAIGDQLGQLYVDKHFKPEAKTKMLELVNNLQATFQDRINGLDWMSDITKQKAIAKLNTFVKKIGYPDKWKDYSNLTIVGDNYVQNILNTSAFEYNYELSKLGKPVDKSQWFMTPNTVNAYYNPAFNEIVFPAAILQFPFFDFDADDAINYGGIGAVIGHEMTHGFDDQGCQYDADGNLKNWWTEEDAKKFGNKTNLVVNQFNHYTVLGDVPVNGQLTLGENIADLGGLAIAYEAFKKTKQGQSEEKIDGFTPDQRFFLSWAQIWRGKATDERARQLIKIDPHSPGEWRANGPLSNFEPFYKAFNVKEGDNMYRADSIRAKIW